MDTSCSPSIAPELFEQQIIRPRPFLEAGFFIFIADQHMIRDMIYTIPGTGDVELTTIILDLNGTVTVGGKIVEGVHERIRKLKDLGFTIIFLTGNTRNNADELAKELGIEWIFADTAVEKKRAAETFDVDTLVSIGNGHIDEQLMKLARLRIVTLQAEGVHVQTLLHSDIVVPHINDALDLFIDPQRLIATLRS